MFVSDYMSASPVTVRSEDNYDLAFEIMEEKNMHHLPVVNQDNHVVGIVTGGICSWRHAILEKHLPKSQKSCILPYSQPQVVLRYLLP